MFNVKSITSPAGLDCGATCLQMLLSYYGIESDLKILTAECNTSINGCTALDLKKTGAKHGLDLRAYNMPVEELIRQDRPAIIHWKHNHFCVFCGINEDDNIVICNPDRGRYGVPIKYFKQFYCNVAMFNGEPEEILIQTKNDRIKELEERTAMLEEQNQMLTECLLEVADIIYA